MPIVEIPKEDLEYPILPEGTYGPGMEFEADVAINRFEYPAVDNMPGWHKEGDKRRYAFFEFTVREAEGGFFTLSRWITLGQGPQLATFLTAAGVDLSTTDTGGIAFEIEDVAGRKVNGVVINAPRPDKSDPDKLWQGDVKEIIG